MKAENHAFPLCASLGFNFLIFKLRVLDHPQGPLQPSQSLILLGQLINQCSEPSVSLRFCLPLLHRTAYLPFSSQLQKKEWSHLPQFPKTKVLEGLPPHLDSHVPIEKSFQLTFSIDSEMLTLQRSYSNGCLTPTLRIDDVGLFFIYVDMAEILSAAQLCALNPEYVCEWIFSLNQYLCCAHLDLTTGQDDSDVLAGLEFRYAHLVCTGL